jgi:phosphate transport system substrate-binding protein
MITRCLVLVILAAFVAGCQTRKEVSTTRGSITIECDESILPVMQQQVEDFQRSYTEAHITLRPVGARAAFVDFINDTTQVIAVARPFNDEEMQAVKAAAIEYREYHVAFDAVAVILHKDHPARTFRVGELDSIFTGAVTHWPETKGRSKPIALALSGVNSSTNEIFRTTILKDKAFAASASYYESSSELIDAVANDPNTIGIVGLSWLKGTGDIVAVASIGDPSWRPDSTQPFGHFYSPAQANVYRGYYLLSTRLYMYNRELLRTVGLGFIAYIVSVPGQRIFQESGLVPATMPVRLIETTSKQVNKG